MNPVLILTCNNLDLTKRCTESVKAQDIPIEIAIIDNGSTDGTREWLGKQNIQTVMFESNRGVSIGWNAGLGLILATHSHALVIGNDTILAPWAYSALLSADVPFVTGVDTGMNTLPAKPDIFPLSPHPDFSCFLIRRECWEKVGPFDERMVSYASDCDYHIRAHRLGIPLWKASVPYNHERSSTINRATAQERGRLLWQANQDREMFKSIHDCLPGTPAYEAIFKEVPVGQAETK